MGFHCAGPRGPAPPMIATWVIWPWPCARPGLRSDKSCQPWKLLLADCVAWWALVHHHADRMVAGVLQHVVKTGSTPVLSAADPERRASAPGLDPAPTRPRMGAVSGGCPNHSVTTAARRIRTRTPFAWVGPVWEPLAGSSSLDAPIDLKCAHVLRHAIHKRQSRGAIGRKRDDPTVLYALLFVRRGVARTGGRDVGRHPYHRCQVDEVHQRPGDPKKAKVAVARNLAAILFHIWKDGTKFQWRKEA
jgi:hypothetical protein